MKKMLPESKVEAIRKEGFLNRAVEAYRFFYPTVSNVSNFKALNDLGITENHDFIIQLTTPDLNVLTQNSDTPILPWNGKHREWSSCYRVATRRYRWCG